MEKVEIKIIRIEGMLETTLTFKNANELKKWKTQINKDRMDYMLANDLKALPKMSIKFN